MAHRLMTRRSQCSLVAGVVAIATLFGSVAPFTTAAAPNRPMDAVDAVKWTVDKPTKTITVEVHLAFFTNARIPDGRGDTVSSRIAFIQAAILKAWDGQKFKCYTVRVKLVVRQVDNVDDVRDDEVPIELDASIYPIGDRLVLDRGGGNGIRRSYVQQDGDDTDQEYLSEDPSSAVRPVTGPQATHSTWHMFESSRAYEHEFGHILGLGDSYVDDRTGQTRPNAVNDLMSNRNRIDETTITRMIRRAGIDDKELPCPMTWDLPDAVFRTFFDEVHMSIHAWTCDYDPPSNAPGATPQIIFTGDITSSGGHSDPVFGSVSGSGVEHFTTTYPVGDPALLLVLSTGLVVKQTVVPWMGGLLATHHVALVVPEGSLELGATSEFKLEATECPP